MDRLDKKAVVSLEGGFPPVQHKMYCAEQIIIPQPFPDILKTFAKAAIRTQPYDLLRWSAAYFRCMATNVPPPVKQRLERQCRFGTLTRGYLRVLLAQLGRGFFVSREVLQSRWESMALPETDLLSFLSLGRMLHWPQVHWLKLFAVMVGSLNASLLDTLTMLCELLTDDVEGSPSAIPMWMLRECYVFLAELDCGDSQRFVDGRKIIGENLLEDPSEMPDLPKLLSLESFRNAIVEKFNERLGVENNYSRQDFPYRLDDPGLRDATDADCQENASDAGSVSSRPSHISSSFRFIGDYADPTQVIRRTPDFDSVILLLHEAQGYSLHQYDGPHSIADKTLRHARRRDDELRERRAHQARLVLETAGAVTQLEHDRLLDDVEPPWSWIHQFASATCRDKSYNFVENQSIASDETPAESSDESFDFERNRFRQAPGESETDDACERGVEDMLLKRPAASDSSTADDVKRDTARLVEQLLDDVMAMLERALVRKQIALENTQSVATFMLDNDPADGGGGQGQHTDGFASEGTPCLPAGSLNLAAVRVAIRHADEQHMVFKNLVELREYLEGELHLEEPVAEEKIPESPVPIIDSTLTDEQFVSTNPSADAPPPPPTPPQSIVQLLAPDERRPPLVDQFEECNVEVDEKLLSKQVPDQMILGLVQTPPRTPVIAATPPQTPSEPPPTPHNTTSGFITANVSTHEFPEPYAQVPYARPPSPLPREPFRCDVPAMRGIGPPVSKETIVNFVTYLTGRARTERGLVFPRHFREAECPNAVDAFDA